VANQLNIGDTFPAMTLNVVGGGGTITVPDDLDTDYNIVLLYRGHW
tara:strand:- start:285 stop:422 length:138 start_codon:yes stop_codon:yes gene_type:complete